MVMVMMLHSTVCTKHLLVFLVVNKLSLFAVWSVGTVDYYSFNSRAALDRCILFLTLRLFQPVNLVLWLDLVNWLTGWLTSWLAALTIDKADLCMSRSRDVLPFQGRTKINGPRRPKEANREDAYTRSAWTYWIVFRSPTCTQTQQLFIWHVCVIDMSNVAPSGLVQSRWCWGRSLESGSVSGAMLQAQWNENSNGFFFAP